MLEEQLCHEAFRPDRAFENEQAQARDRGGGDEHAEDVGDHELAAVEPQKIRSKGTRVDA